MLVPGEEVTLFLESVQSEELSHTSEFFAADTTRVVNSTGGKIMGVVMDNTSANKKAWRSLKRSTPVPFLPRLYCTRIAFAYQGCVFCYQNKTESSCCA